MKYKYTLIIITVIALFVGRALIDVNHNKGVKMAEVLCRDPSSKEANDFFSNDEGLFVTSLIRLLEKKDIDDSTKVAAISYLSATKDTRPVKLLLNLLHSDNEQIRYVTVITLGDIGDKTATKDLCALWLSETRDNKGTDKNEFKNIQFQIAIALAKICDKEAVPYLLETYKSGNKSVKLICAVALYEILGGDSYFNDIKEALRDDNLKIRFMTLSMLGDIGNKKAIPLLEGLLNDDNPKIRTAAQKYLDLMKSDKMEDEK
jgi:HEAT repeat protein